MSMVRARDKYIKKLSGASKWESRKRRFRLRPIGFIDKIAFEPNLT